MAEKSGPRRPEPPKRLRSSGTRRWILDNLPLMFRFIILFLFAAAAVVNGIGVRRIAGQMKAAQSFNDQDASMLKKRNGVAQRIRGLDGLPLAIK